VVGRVLAALGLADELAPPSRPDLTPVAAAPRGKALVAEDDHVNQLITSSYLRRLGYEVDVVADGGAAIEAAERGGYDVLVLDAHMPVLDGLAVTRRVRALPDARAQVRIIALTAGASASDRAACLDAGMDDFIAKPATSEALDAALTAPRGSPQVSRSGIWAARQSPIIDRNRLRELLEVDQTGAVGREVVGLFRISIADRLDRLSGPLAADASGTRAEAHAIKGAAESVGAATLALLARRIESSAARGDLSTVPFLLAEARSAFSRAVETLEKALAAPAP
jgi:CheY-like chemotaxis protein